MTPKTVTAKIDGVIHREKGYVNDPTDRGGETNFGVTVAVARAFGYQGRMIDMPRAVAVQIYLERFWLQPKFDQVADLNDKIAEKMFDIGVNGGTATPVKFLQRALNHLNRQGTDFPDISVDGGIGKMTLFAMAQFLKLRGSAGAESLYELIGAQQRVRYMEITEGDATQEKYSNGWQTRAGDV